MHEVVFAPEARDDLLGLYEYIATHSNATRAHSFAKRIVDYCQSLAMFQSVAPGATSYGRDCGRSVTGVA